MRRSQRGGSGRQYIGDKCEFTDPAGITDDCMRGIRCTKLGDPPRTYNLCLPYKTASLAEHRRLLKPLDNSSYPNEREKAVKIFEERFPGENFSEPKLVMPPRPEVSAAAKAAQEAYDKHRASPEYPEYIRKWSEEQRKLKAERNAQNFGFGGSRRSKTKRRQRKQRRQSRRN